MGLEKPGRREAIEAVAEFQASDAPCRAQRNLRPGDTMVETVRPSKGCSTLPPVRHEIVVTTPTVVPPASVLGDLADGLAPLRQLAATNRAKSRTLVDLRDTLLPKLISGELRVPQPEPLLQAAS